jgi:hypothetical protein
MQMETPREVLDVKSSSAGSALRQQHQPQTLATNASSTVSSRQEQAIHPVGSKSGSAPTTSNMHAGQSTVPILPSAPPSSAATGNDKSGLSEIKKMDVAVTEPTSD